MFRLLQLAASITLMISVAGCAKAATARQMYRDVLRKCTNADQIGGRELYMGPSNPVGPGSVWRRAAGGYNLRWTLDRAIPNESERQQLIQPGTDASCQGVSITKSKLAPSFSISGIVPVTGELSGDLSAARTVTLSTDFWRWDQIQELPYESAINQLRSNGSHYALDLSQPDRFVVGKALRVRGITAELSFDATRIGTLKAKYPALAIAPGATADLGGGVSASWSNQTTLKMQSGGDFYIAVQLYPWSETGLASGQPELLIVSPIAVPPSENAQLTPEM